MKLAVVIILFFFDKQDTGIQFLRTEDLIIFSVNQIPDKFVDMSIYSELKQIYGQMIFYSQKIVKWNYNNYS